MNQDRKSDQFLYAVLAAVLAAIALIIVSGKVEQKQTPAVVRAEDVRPVEVSGESKKLMEEVEGLGEAEIEADFGQLKSEAEGL
ncbi:hypothetical protein A3H89_02955 [Candidatus Amesbacteria bacterium RIFCSPLOWO2_02_FULL_48_11]|uniref:Uncharacterized protein n=1 Tax=Candidatus Amesbacteria bacterium GW2011_GWA2_47_11 TaxID=1618357 RepID=A0A0G1RDX4_9BACT|nr:MAG: hypothetical protein UX78_C0022G0006 [Candidatus Amesbacteria bacterium GW2011_GWA2_47_11]OGC91323.1 MAG: hypothetical protein A2V48_00170 [Candidatus Amesbacteria bacterium RBG_19FT_COMBO_48_16]OGC97555.1 MAG: hypothetical protein A2W16_03055 [Candidatus Amesbacteria bacterium RBG_16_48_31]OGD06582.1 MAG: hypothetical protein A3B58_02355 [Candidatus Amesbacteria bacterium RIFCSPLOWO2_01_FULL_48_50]OGD08272.1 MAG: hypothetical protein A3H89_02955 [Candidatus Amesbacteria bacterium RIFCS